MEGGDTLMNERLKILRKTLGLTQQEFADRIGSKRNTVAKYETDANTPSTAVISLICREFNVNEEWLRNGTGEMFLPADRNSDIARLTKQLLNEEPDSFKNRFISMLSNLTVDEWELLERKALELCGTDNKNSAYNSAPDTPEELEANFVPVDQSKNAM